MPELILKVDADEVTIVASATLGRESLLEPGLTVDIGRVTHEGQYLFLYVVRGQWEQMVPGYHPVLFSKAIFTCEADAWNAEGGDKLLQALAEGIAAQQRAHTTDAMRLLMLAKLVGAEV